MELGRSLDSEEPNQLQGEQEKDSKEPQQMQLAPQKDSMETLQEPANSTLLLSGQQPLAQSYGIWVNGVELTTENAENPMDGVSYDAETNTLTLQGAYLTECYTGDRYHSAVIYAKGDICIDLVGENEIYAFKINGSTFVDGIYAEGVVTIEGNGSLDVSVTGVQTTGEYGYGCGIATFFVEDEAGVIINSGEVTLSGDGTTDGYGIYIDTSHGGTLPPRYIQINGGTVTLKGTSAATLMAPDFSEYEGGVVTAALDVDGTDTQDYVEENVWLYKYLKIGALEYDEDGFAEGNHYQPPMLNDNGTANDPTDDWYEIKNAGNLFWFSKYLADDENHIGANAKLVQDIVIPKGRIFDPISAGTYHSGFGGTFDGQNHTISGVVIQPQVGFASTGFFTMVTEKGVVKNVGVINAQIYSSTSTIGTICGKNKGTIENCYAVNTTINGGMEMIGGISGENVGTIQQCYNASNITASGYNSGGISGKNEGTIVNCYNTGDISGKKYVGGITNNTSQTAEVKTCYNIGMIQTSTGNESWGYGIAGMQNGVSTITDCYYLAESEKADGGKTQASFESGEVAYWLNKNQESDDYFWRQTLTGNDRQLAPAFDGEKVYVGYAHCYSTEISYSNDSTISMEKPEHRFTTYNFDTVSHWQVCANEGCAESNREDSLEEHQFQPVSGKNYEVCGICGAQKEVEGDFSISGQVVSNSNTAISVSLVQGNKQISSQTISPTMVNGLFSGSFSFDQIKPGVYNIVAKQDGQEMTVLVVIEGENETVAIQMPDGSKNSVINNENAEEYASVVGGLDDIAEKEEVQAGETVTIELTVTKVEDMANDTSEENQQWKKEQTAIKEAVGTGSFDFVDFTLTKITEGESEEIGDQNTEVLEIVFPFDFSRKQNVALHRYHGDGVEGLNELETLPTETLKDGTVYLDKQHGLIHVYACKFSTYAISYTKQSSSSSSSGGGSHNVSWSPSVEESENGSISFDRESPKEGDKVTIIPKPDEGYETGTVTVLDKNGNAIAVVDNEDGTYTFVQPEGKVTVAVDFVKTASAGEDWKSFPCFLDCPKDATCVMEPYVDLDKNQWYHDGVHYCIQANIMTGISSTEFSPNTNITRGMIAMMLWNMEGNPKGEYRNLFTDVLPGDWYEPAVSWAAAEGIVHGFGDGTFGPNDPITREQLAVILYQYSSSSETNFDEMSFLDASQISAWAKTAVQWAVQNNVINGMGDGTVNPQGNTTRAQAATMFRNSCCGVLQTK